MEKTRNSPAKRRAGKKLEIRNKRQIRNGKNKEFSVTSVSSVAEHDSIPHCAAIILCAGRGTRMGTTRIPKVCLPVAGKPAVNRTIQAYRECGVRTNVIVVGADAG